MQIQFWVFCYGQNDANLFGFIRSADFKGIEGLREKSN